jgi:hypothetical protein
VSKLHLLPSAEPIGETVAITWHTDSETCIATCGRCAESTHGDDGWAWAWADSHVCDTERVALLALLGKRAA